MIPFFELVQHNFREGAASLADVLSWAYPWRRLITFLAPNFFGNPSHHGYFDIFSWRSVPATANAYGGTISKIDWGMKNYVEGGAYLGILPLLLAAITTLTCLRRRDCKLVSRTKVVFFVLLSLASLSFIFRTGTYAIIHAIPIINQSHSPFRWVFPLSLSVAVLAGWGADIVGNWTKSDTPEKDRKTKPLLAWIIRLSLGGGALGLGLLALGRLFYGRLEPWIDRAFMALAKAPEAFSGPRAPFSATK